MRIPFQTAQGQVFPFAFRLRQSTKGRLMTKGQRRSFLRCGCSRSLVSAVVLDAGQRSPMSTCPCDFSGVGRCPYADQVGSTAEAGTTTFGNRSRRCARRANRRSSKVSRASQCPFGRGAGHRKSPCSDRGGVGPGRHGRPPRRTGPFAWRQGLGPAECVAGSPGQRIDRSNRASGEGAAAPRWNCHPSGAGTTAANRGKSSSNPSPWPP